MALPPNPLMQLIAARNKAMPPGGGPVEQAANALNPVHRTMAMAGALDRLHGIQNDMGVAAGQHPNPVGADPALQMEGALEREHGLQNDMRLAAGESPLALLLAAIGNHRPPTGPSMPHYPGFPPQHGEIPPGDLRGLGPVGSHGEHYTAPIRRRPGLAQAAFSALQPHPGTAVHLYQAV
jgi:hypothetical protein